MHTRLLGVRAARCFDGHTLQEGPVLVLVRDGLIVDVDRTGAAAPEGTELVELGDCTLLPGLIDSHVHLSWDPLGRHEDMATTATDVLVARAQRHAEQALHAGVTTLRDLGDRAFATVDLRDTWASGPELLVAGPPITPTRGHCWFLGGEADTRDDVVAAVAERAARRTDWVKVMATGGFSTSGTDPVVPHYPPATLTALVEAAHGHGLPVAAHAHATAGIADAVAAGVDTVEHCTFHAHDRPGVVVDARTVEAMAARGTCASITVARARADRPQWIQDVVNRMGARALALLAAGVPVALSTDAGIIPTKPHDVLPADLVHAAGLGLTNQQVLTAATATAARACGIAHRAGRLTPGYGADLLAVAGNPLHTITALLDVRAVFKAGVRTR